MKLLVTEDILWVVNPVDGGKTDLCGSRQMESEVFLESMALRLRGRLADLLEKSRLRTRRPLRVTDFNLSDESILIIYSWIQLDIIGYYGYYRIL